MINKILGLLAVGLMVSLDSPADSVVIDGVFTGFVDAGGTGNIGTLNASTVAAGTPIFGIFSYNPQIFPIPPLNENTGVYANYYALGSSSPAVITAFVGGSAFTISGTVQSQLTLESFSSGQDPNNHLYLETMNYGASVPSGGFSGSIDLNLSNYLGAPFASSVDNPGSVAFANQNGLGVNQVDTLQALSSQGNNTGSLYFSISHAWAAPVPTSAPEIDPTSAAGGLTLLLGSLVVLRSRRSVKLDSAAA
jgi:hypothetical protein